jgi:hypothetical protein
MTRKPLSMYRIEACIQVRVSAAVAPVFEERSSEVETH